ncbi:MAG: hypothetical protein CVV25_01075 [Ignavibacteriae bacterium HGW-Ignavibacteriae-4]|jgi:hypothetical protein|nr:MAG: hypothetical protein CVV25_01075 [Ignavibacteriae bacterium HGW-Ignavibacteriae-4]
MKQIIIKSATIILFLSLITIFIAFRSGYFGGKKSSVPVSPNGSALNNQTKNSQRDTIKKNNIIKISKANIAKEESQFLKNRIVKAYETAQYKVSDSTNRNNVDPGISSSKSLILSTPSKLRQLIEDAKYTDTIID